VTVTDSDDDTLDATFYGRQAAAAAPDFTIVTLPDTQFYSQSYPATFTAQTTWIRDSAGTLNTVFVAHLGDITNGATQPEWKNASASMQVLDAAGIPNGVPPGNHDFSNIGLYDATFPVSRYSANDWYADSMPGRANRDSYQLFSAGGLDFIILHLEYNPDTDVRTWARGILAGNGSRRAIVVTHEYMGSSGRSSVGDGLWTSLVSPHCNVFLVLSGHYVRENRLTSTNSCGNPVYQALQDYQSDPNGGDGWLRYYTFKPSENKIYAYTYSPTLNGGAGQSETDADSQFTLDYAMSGAGSWQVVGTATGVHSGDHATVAWNGLANSQQYEWYATVSDGSLTTTGPTWSFTTAASTTPTLSGTITAGGTPLVATVSVFDSTTFAWAGNATSAADGTFSLSVPPGTYKLYLQPTTPGYVDQWYGGDGVYWSSATPVTVSGATSVPISLVP
jgi:hypothetical protein